MYLVDAEKKRIVKLGYVLRATVTMIKEILDCTDDETFLSIVCVDPQIICLALFQRNE